MNINCQIDLKNDQRKLDEVKSMYEMSSTVEVLSIYLPIIKYPPTHLRTDLPAKFQTLIIPLSSSYQAKTHHVSSCLLLARR